MIARRFFLLASFLSGAVALSAPTSAASITPQGPCAATPCVTFSGGGTIPTTLRSFVFAAPGAGKAAVTFTGSMFCSAGGASASQRVGDFVTQIVPAAATVPNIAGPSALRIAFRLGAPGPDLFGLSSTTNLATTRVFTVSAAGTQRYFLNLATLRMDTTISCAVYDAAFTVFFAP